MDLSKLSPAPWECENHSECSERSVHAFVTDANGKTLFDTLNSDVAVIHTEHDEYGAHYSDEQGRVDLGFAALARNAFAGDPEALAWWEANRVKTPEKVQVRPYIGNTPGLSND